MNNKNKNGGNKFSKEFLEEVKKCLPEQPWPKGVHDSVAKKMGISSNVAASAIGMLMKRNMVKKQRNGKIII